MQIFLGVVREACTGDSSLRLTRSDYTAKILEDAVKLGFGSIRTCTTAEQSGTPADPKLLLEQPCDPGVRALIGSSTSPSSLHGVRGLPHVRACGLERNSGTFSVFVAHSAEWSLVVKSADDDWEELPLTTFCDAAFGTRCFRGFKKSS